LKEDEVAANSSFELGLPEQVALAGKMGSLVYFTYCLWTLTPFTHYHFGSFWDF
jgi:hypothetical protein